MIWHSVLSVAIRFNGLPDFADLVGESRQFEPEFLLFFACPRMLVFTETGAPLKNDNFAGKIEKKKKLYKL